MSFKGNRSPNVMVVDDQPDQLDVLCDLFRRKGYTVRGITSGQHALDAVDADPPDVILLDIAMPGMDGLEVCERLKRKRADVARIPIIFVTATDDIEAKVRAFSLGGADYVTKPLNLREVEARVDSQVRICALERLRDDLIGMVAHDMGTPLQAILSSLDVLNRPDLSPKDGERVRRALNATCLLEEMTASLRDISRFDAGAVGLVISDCQIGTVAADVVDRLRPLAGGRHLEVKDESGAHSVPCDSALIGRVIQNLVSNAIKFTRPDGTIVIAVGKAGEAMRVSVRDDGEGIPAHFIPRVFDRFARLDARKQRENGHHSSGLGLTFCKLVVEAHGGQIGVTSEVGKGSIFWFALPLDRNRE